MPLKPEYIVWHTAAHGSAGVDYDTTAAQIDRWHRDRGWAGIGYHFVVRKDGTIEKGRAETRTGAHVLGLNSKSLGICFSGHGDISAHTEAQREAGLELTRKLMEKYDIPADNVIGHREVNDLIKSGVLSSRYKVAKTCPGLLVNMDTVRQELVHEEAPAIRVPGYSKEQAKALYEHVRGVYDAVKALKLEAEAYDELNTFRREPHIDVVITRYKKEIGEA